MCALRRQGQPSHCMRAHSSTRPLFPCLTLIVPSIVCALRRQAIHSSVPSFAPSHRPHLERHCRALLQWFRSHLPHVVLSLLLRHVRRPRPSVVPAVLAAWVGLVRSRRSRLRSHRRARGTDGASTAARPAAHGCIVLSHPTAPEDPRPVCLRRRDGHGRRRLPGGDQAAVQVLRRVEVSR